MHISPLANKYLTPRYFVAFAQLRVGIDGYPFFTHIDSWSKMAIAFSKRACSSSAGKRSAAKPRTIALWAHNFAREARDSCHTEDEKRTALFMLRVRGVYADVCEELERIDPDENERCLICSDFADAIEEFVEGVKRLEGTR